ncbi:GNAT family N-acetyltransferase [Pseudarthrobacter sp. J64]|uniref:GNAT family N-acetyltransferase n=1 Tax=Pseudarthrobacter sp. J64 TaxID=3116485 RepID=UPI002E80EB2A|nr:GNAT family N-acetyltransferase [Pseudarthrobacter sp. J64]MEE2569014.1 GNAT family N-acetyltransferase [Pseudarthrobacter sp. J64]
MSGDYQIRRFAPALKDEPGYGQSVAWGQAVNFGFHDERRPVEQVDQMIGFNKVDRRVYTGVYQKGAVAQHSLDAEIPVATFGTFRKTLNVGFGRLLEAQLVTSVTVRTSHRRRGLLRAMMSQDLAQAREDGLAMAALTASEASIYGRFGFGVATLEQSIKVDTGARFVLNHVATGTVEVADPKVLLELAPAVFDRVHALTPGSVGRQEFYRQLASGSVSRGGGEDPKVKVALHYDAAGEVDGYVSYKFGGWSETPYTMEIVDLVAAGNNAYLELWQYLGAIDLVERVTWAEAPVDDPLRWALADARCVSASEPRDMLWLRILDVGKALEARHYPADGRLVMAVSDSLGFAQGTFVLEVDGGTAVVRAAGAAGGEPDLELDIAALSSIYLGGVNPVTLAAAGVIREHLPGAAFRAARMFAVERPVHCLTHF